MIRYGIMTIAALVSSLVFAVTVTSWVRGYFVQDKIYQLDANASGWGIDLVQGHIWYTETVYIQAGLTKPSAGWNVLKIDGTAHPPTLEWHLLGFQYATSTAPFGRRGHSRSMSVPHWFPALLSALLPAWWRFKSRPRRMLMRRARLGQCLNCGYSITGNVSGVCPECGTPVPNKLKVIA